jgi:hypothetical protein
MREDNVWFALGTGDDAAWMSQVFTVTKGRKRHTFALSTYKTTMVSMDNVSLAVEEIQDLVKRAYSIDPAVQESELSRANIKAYNKLILDARDNNESGMFGGAMTANFSVIQFNYELLNVEYNGTRMFSALRYTDVSLTLVRSDVLPVPVTPFGSCNKFFQNEATGGKVERTSCYRSNGEDQSGHRFLGQVDTSSSFVIAGILGDGSTNTSAKALD